MSKRLGACPRVFRFLGYLGFSGIKCKRYENYYPDRDLSVPDPNDDLMSSTDLPISDELMA